jgi:hypothetical protein
VSGLRGWLPPGILGCVQCPDLSYEKIVPTRVAAVPALRDRLQEHIQDNGEILQHVFFGCELVPFVLAAWSAGSTEVVGRCLKILEAAMTCTDDRTCGLVAVSFVEQVGPWEPDVKPFVATWPPALAREALRHA